VRCHEVSLSRSRLIALRGGQVEPHVCADVVLRHAAALGIRDAETGLREELKSASLILACADWMDVCLACASRRMATGDGTYPSGMKMSRSSFIRAHPATAPRRGARKPAVRAGLSDASYPRGVIL
jgi:hypothetical protein